MKTRRNLFQLCLLGAVLLTALNCRAQSVTQISADYQHSMFLKSDGSLWVMGLNLDGELGDGTYNDDTNLPEMVVASNVTAIATGYYHSLFISNNGCLWAMGLDENGQLGNGTTFNQLRPEQIVTNNVTAIAAGQAHSLFIKSDGSLWGMGYRGFLGDGSTIPLLHEYTNLPEQIVTSNVTAVAAGVSHSLFLKSDGSLWATGANLYGQLGDGHGNINTNVFEQIVPSNVTAIAAGWNHSLFIKNDGSLWGMGDNQNGQLGIGTYYAYGTNTPQEIVASNVTAIAGGEYFSLFIKRDGSLWGMGDNFEGELGNGRLTNSTNMPVQIVASNVVAIAAGSQHTLFVKSDGSLWSMGDNLTGQLGNGTSGTSYQFVSFPEQVVVNPFYNQITGQLLGTGDVQLSFTGIAGNNYALDVATSLAPPNWMPQATNTANSLGALVFTNTPDPTTNNFWRIRSVP